MAADALLHSWPYDMCKCGHAELAEFPLIVVARRVSQWKTSEGCISNVAVRNRYGDANYVYERVGMNALRTRAIDTSRRSSASILPTHTHTAATSTRVNWRLVLPQKSPHCPVDDQTSAYLQLDQAEQQLSGRIAGGGVAWAEFCSNANQGLSIEVAHGGAHIAVTTGIKASPSRRRHGALSIICTSKQLIGV